jgi:hypothetical protein
MGPDGRVGEELVFVSDLDEAARDYCVLVSGGLNLVGFR